TGGSLMIPVALPGSTGSRPRCTQAHSTSPDLAYWYSTGGTAPVQFGSSPILSGRIDVTRRWSPGPSVHWDPRPAPLGDERLPSAYGHPRPVGRGGDEPVVDDVAVPGGPLPVAVPHR